LCVCGGCGCVCVGGVCVCGCVCVCVCVCVISWSEELNFAVLHTVFVTSQPRIVRMRQGNPPYRNWESFVEYDTLQSDRILLAFLRTVIP